MATRQNTPSIPGFTAEQTHGLNTLMTLFASILDKVLDERLGPQQYTPIQQQPEPVPQPIAQPAPPTPYEQPPKAGAVDYFVATLEVQKEQGSIPIPTPQGPVVSDEKHMVSRDIYVFIDRRKDLARTWNSGVKDVSAPCQQQQQQLPQQLPLPKQEQGTTSAKYYHPDWGKSDPSKLGPIRQAPR